ncbi:MAG: nuclear transport factor 2 family protein [Sandaracinaceae bacterium]
MLRTRVESFLRDYARAFGALDPERIASFYAPPCAFVNPLSRSMISDAESLRAYFARITRVHRKTGWGGASATLVRLHPHGGHFADAVARWHVIDARGAPLWNFEHGYLLTTSGPAIRIVSAIGY